MKNRNPILCLGLLLFSSTALSGCSWSSGTGGNEPPEMHKQYSRAIDIQTSIVVGDLDRAKEAATWLATYDGIEGFPPGSDEFWAEIRRYAALISQAEDLGAVAVRSARSHQLADTAIRPPQEDPLLSSDRGHPRVAARPGG